MLTPPHSTINRTTKPKKISQYIDDLNNTINQLDLTDIDRLRHLKPREYSFYSNAHYRYIKR